MVVQRKDLKNYDMLKLKKMEKMAGNSLGRVEEGVKAHLNKDVMLNVTVNLNCIYEYILDIFFNYLNSVCNVCICVFPCGRQGL